MTTTFVDTSKCPRVSAGNNRGEVAEIVNEALCGAKNVKGMLRWLKAGERFDAERKENAFQLLYLMEGDGVISLAGKDYDVMQGAGVYLEPSETAGIRQRGTKTLKLFHLVVPKLPH